VPVTDELLANNAAYARYFTSGDLPMPPGKKVAVLACMDARLNVYGALGLREGDAHVIRNAGGVVTDDAIRSLMISQRLIGTREIILIHHTDCGMLTFRDSVHQSPPITRPRATAWAAYAACALALLSAVPSFYWALGGTAGLDTVGGAIEELARTRDPAGVVLGIGAGVLKVAGGCWRWHWSARGAVRSPAGCCLAPPGPPARC
jgi:hypothetical protein